MELIEPDNSLINDASIMRDYRIDFRLSSYSIIDNKRKDFSGLDTYSVGEWKEGIGFGITNIQIETNASLQPVVEITFKDLYGNSVFVKNANPEPNYRSLFDWPPPKFDLSFKGYLGRTTNLKLNLKKTDISYNSSDGSFTIKCSFVPNMWGPFADMPAMFLYAVKALKLGDNLKSGTFDTFIDLIKLGEQIQVKTKNVSDKYTVVQKQLNAVNFDLGQAMATETLKPGKISSMSQKTSQDIVGFTGITIYNYKTDKDLNGTNGDLKKIANDNSNSSDLSEYLLLKSNVGDTPVISDDITYPIYTSLKAAIKTGQASDEQKSQSTKYVSILSNKRAIIESDLRKIDDEINAESFTENQDKISKVVISQLFSKLGGDTGYILGRILQAGLQGYEGATKERESNDNIIGKYFPLEITDRATDSSSSFQGAQRPVRKDSPLFKTGGGKINEWVFVDAFIESISKGIAESPGISTNTDDPTKDKLISRINNLEIFQGSPYVPEYGSIISNILIRSGIWGYFSRSTDPNNPQGYFENKTGKNAAQTAAQNELNNIKPILTNVSDDDIKKIQNACLYFDAAINDDGDYFDPYASIDFKSIDGTSTSNKYPEIAPIGTLDIAGISGGTGTTYGLLHNNLYWSKPSWGNETDGLRYVMLSFDRSLSQSFDMINSSTSDSTYKDTQKQEGTYTDIFTWGKGYQPPGIVSVNEYSPDKKNAYYGRQKIYNYYAEHSDNSINSMLDYSFFTKSASVFNPSNPNAIISESDATSNISSISGASSVPLEYTVFYSNEGLSENEFNMCWGLFEDGTGAQNQRKFLKSLCSALKAAIDQIKQNKVTTTAKIATRAQKMEDEIYTQFHHIFYQWYSLIYNEPTEINNLNSTSQYLSGELPAKIEMLYSAYTTQGIGCSSSGYQTGFQYIAPLIKTASGDNIDVENSVINIDSCNHIDANTTVLNIIQNICTHNNFLFFPIAGGDPYNLAQVFEVETAGGNQLNFGNRFVVMWAPTPEARITNNSGKDLSFIQDKQYINSSSCPICAFDVRIGSTDNALFKNLNVSTDSTKTTAESIANLQNLVDPKVQEKFQTKDCSTIPVIEGRSYTCEVETLGNAQLSPMQYFYLDKIPIFGGLYQIMGVKHNITPNNMITTFKGMKMRFNAGRYGGIPPVTLKSLSELAQHLNIVSNNTNTALTPVQNPSPINSNPNVCPINSPHYFNASDLNIKNSQIYKNPQIYAAFQRKGLITSDGNLTAKGVFAAAISINEGINQRRSIQYDNFNPGNIRSLSDSYAKYNSWDEGIQALLDRYINQWIINKKLPPFAGAVTLVNCFINKDNQYFASNNINYSDLTNYSYTQHSIPTLRQYFNQYAPLTDSNNPTVYAASVYKTLKANNINVSSIDQPMTDFIV